MDPTLDNRMILGGIGNLRLAPHVREGRAATSVSRVPRPALPAAPPEGSAPSRAPGFVAQEKVTISAAGRSALAGEAPDVASAPASAPEVAGPAPAPAPPAPSTLLPDVVPSTVASAYAAASQTTAPAGAPGAAPTVNALFA